MYSVIVTLSTKVGTIERVTRPLADVLKENMADARDIELAVNENRIFRADIGSGWKIQVARA